jgi:O-antigen/teichoic acid export membrane protein
LSLFGLSVATTKYVAHYLEADTQRVGRIAGTALLLTTTISVVVGLGLYLLLNSGLWGAALRGAGVLATTQSVLVTYAPVLAGLVIVLTFKTMVSSIVYGLHEFRALVNVNLVIGLISLPVLFLLVQQRSLAGALEARLVLAAAEALLLLWPVWRIFKRTGIRLSLRDTRMNTRQLTTFGLPTFIGQMIASPVQPLMLSLLAAQPGGLAQVGLITVAGRLPSLANFIPSSMASTLIPVLSTEWGRGDHVGFRNGVFAALRMLWLSALPVLLFFMAASPALIVWLYGADFSAAWLPAFILLILALLGAINEGADRSLAAAGRQWLSTGNNLIGTVMILLASVWLIPTYLAEGYAVAYCVPFGLYVLLQLGWLRRLFGVVIRRLWPLLVISVVAIMSAWFVASYTTGLVQVIVAGLLMLFSVIFIWYVLLSPSEREALIGHIPRAGRVLNQLPGYRRPSETDE